MPLEGPKEKKTETSGVHGVYTEAHTALSFSPDFLNSSSVGLLSALLRLELLSNDYSLQAQGTCSDQCRGTGCTPATPTSFLCARCQDSLISFLRLSCSNRRRVRG